MTTRRLGVIGQSYGGYTVNALITQTNRFKAAVSSASISDLPSLYLSKYVAADPEDQEGINRIGGTLWKYPERYVKNSPIFHLNRVQTPLLLVHGTKDEVVPVEQAEEMYQGLAKLGKEVELAEYPGAGHNVAHGTPEQQMDFEQRIFKWFERHLK